MAVIKSGDDVQLKASDQKADREHPSHSLDQRRKGFGIGGGYEKPYRKRERSRSDSNDGPYGAIAQTGYYGAGKAAERFDVGEAGFGDEQSWYQRQFGEKTSDFNQDK
ncbi:MAG TPA: hypothetical protein VEZ90_14325 [Blastocatellia bacterium]|nr:hypothetical protein [Blastocatellia bacterium]